LNSRPLRPERSAHTRLRYAPNEHQHSIFPQFLPGTIWIALFLFFIAPLCASEPLQEHAVESISKITLAGKAYSYKAVAGNLVIKDEEGKEKASLFYTAYFLVDDPSPHSSRPLTFCFNGGPGAASVWLNTGFIGPKRIGSNGVAFENPPYTLVDNEDSLLDQSDLVFIDPVSTGLSIAAPGVDVKSLHSLEEDVQLMADFLRQFTLAYRRFDSPKYILGESYGGMRAVKVAYKLHSDYAYYLNGLVLISPALDLETIYSNGLNDLPYLLALPSMTAIASYHKKIEGDLQALVSKSKDFAEGTYAQALFQGTNLPPAARKDVIKQLTGLTGISEDIIDRFDLRIPASVFSKELMKSQGTVAGRFDGRILGLDSQMNPFYSTYDPSLDAVIGVITATYNQYLAEELSWPSSREYRALNPLPGWNWGKGNSYASSLLEFQALMAQNPKMRVVVMEGLFDLACPFATTEYSLSHVGFSKEALGRISSFRYTAGHMMYYNPAIRAKMRGELREFLMKN
jgi:carboxypeptidase C (cathepsin A)